MTTIRIILILWLSGVVACGYFRPPQHQRPTRFSDDSTTDPTDWKLGKDWDRRPLEHPQTERRQVFQLYRTGMGAVGTGVYLGQINGKHLAMTAGHVYQQLKNCAEEVNFLLSLEDHMNYYTCTGWFMKLQQNDVFIFEFEGHSNPSDSFKPLRFSDSKLTTDMPLKIVVVDREQDDYKFSWSVDASEDCRLLAETPRIIKDPDHLNPTDIQSWSLPIGCDAHDGDSGAPVLDGNNQLLGIIWTGKYPKSENAKPLNELEGEDLWTEANYMIPIVKIVGELKELLESHTLAGNDKTQEIVQGIVDGQLK